MNLVWAADITPPTRKLVLLALADYCDDQGGSLYPSLAKIGKKAGCISRCQAQRVIRSFINEGVLSVVANANGGKPGTTPHYQLHVDRIASTYATGSVDAIPTDSAGDTGINAEGSHPCDGTDSAGDMTGVAPTLPKPSINHQLTTNTSSRKQHGSPEDLKAAHWMHDRILTVAPSAKAPNWEAWANEIRLMREQDKRSHHEICELFAWANKDTVFWAANILSPAKLRAKWTTLEAQKNRPAPGPRATRSPASESFETKTYRSGVL